jgi:hypothetical protein
LEIDAEIGSFFDWARFEALLRKNMGFVRFFYDGNDYYKISKDFVKM